MRKTTLSVSELDVQVDDEGVVRVTNVPADSWVVIEGRALEQLLTGLAELLMRAKEPLE